MVRAVLEIIASAKDQASHVFDRMASRGEVAAARMTRGFQSLERSINLTQKIVLGFFAMRIAGPLVDWMTKAADPNAIKPLGDAFKRLEGTFQQMAGSLLEKIAPALTRVVEVFARFVETVLPPLLDGLGKVLSTIWQIGEALYKGAADWLAYWGAAKPPDFMSRKTQDLYETRPETGPYARVLSPEERADMEAQIRYAGAKPGVWTPEQARGEWTPGQLARFRAGWRPPQLYENRLRAAEGRGGYSTDYTTTSPFPNVEVPELNFFDRLADRMRLTTRDIEDGFLRLADTMVGGLASALTDVITRTQDAGDAFRELTKTILRMVMEMTIESGIRGLLNGVFGAAGNAAGAPGGGTSGFGGGGFGIGGGTTNNYYIQAIDTQSFAVAAMRSERATGVHRRMITAAAYSGHTFRQAMQLR